jgi:hypothetical protein
MKDKSRTAIPEWAWNQRRDAGLERVEAVIERQQGVPTKGDDHGLLLDGEHRRAGLLGPHRRVSRGLASAPLLDGVGLMLWRRASALTLSWLRCIARRTASVVVALPWRTWPIARPSLPGG